MNELRIEIADLLAHPGARRALRLDARLDDLGTSVATIDGPVALDLVLERVLEGIVVRGRLSARFRAPCSHCLRPMEGDVAVDVSELFEDFPVDGETYAIDGHTADLEQMVRDALVLELPLAPTCPEGDPACITEPEPHADGEEPVPPADPRWAALSQLEL
jgi:uncharacterized protein